MSQLFAAVLLLLPSLSVRAAPPPALEVPPGSVARWEGEGTTRCGTAQETWDPAGGACWFPVDLLLAEGTLVEVSRWTGEAKETATLRVARSPYPVEKVKVPDTYVHLSPKNAERAKREAERVAALWQLRTRTSFALPLGPPLRNAPPPRNFGTRRVVNGEPKNPHAGADYRAPRGTPVLAVDRGRVVLADGLFYSGGSVFLDHGDGLFSMYFHLDRVD
ncbi:MAG: M23 family metallopeptidase, partial [Deltaproteobacteria bacterium]